MTIAITAESLAIAVIVLAFAVRALFQLFPAASRRGLGRVRVALGMKAASTSAAAAGCSSGCGSCNNCGSTPSVATSTESPIQFQPRAPKR